MVQAREELLCAGGCPGGIELSGKTRLASRRRVAMERAHGGNLIEFFLHHHEGFFSHLEVPLMHGFHEFPCDGLHL